MFYEGSVMGTKNKLVIFAAGLCVMAFAASAGAGEAKSESEIHTASLTTFTSTPEASTQVRASRMMESMGSEVVSVLSDETIDHDARVAFFRKLLARDLDTPVLAKFMLGRYWRKASEAQRERYSAVFHDFILFTYANRLGSAKVERFEVLKAVPSGKKDILVHSRVVRHGASSINAIWRLRVRKEKIVIIDLMVEGISMAVTLRQEFSTMLRTSGGVDGLISQLKSRMG